jgi:choline transport protein
VGQRVRLPYHCRVPPNADTLRFAPASLQKPTSYAIGWLCALGWQSAMPLLSYSSGLQVIALIGVCQPEYYATGWQAALFTIAFVLFGT